MSTKSKKEPMTNLIRILTPDIAPILKEFTMNTLGINTDYFANSCEHFWSLYEFFKYCFCCLGGWLTYFIYTEKNSAFLLNSKSSSHCTVTQSSQCAERALSLLLGCSANAFLRLGGASDRLALRVHSERSSDCSLKGSGYSYGSTTYSDEKYRVYRSKLALPVHLRGSYCAQFFSVWLKFQVNK